MEKLRHRIFNIIQVGNRYDIPSTAFDFFIVIAIFLNMTVLILDTYDELAHLRPCFSLVEAVTCSVFAVEYVLRLWTADCLYPEEGSRGRAVLSFVFSFYGIIDLLSFLPHFLPVVMPVGIVAFRMLRVFRIFKLFRVNSTVDAFNIITSVLYEKKNQIASSLVLVIMLMISASLIMYSLEHEAQPENFRNAFSGIWWSMSTLLTVGYGDIYPVTDGGRFMAIIIAFLGVGVVAIPTGIISAGFVEQYTKAQSQEIAIGSRKSQLDLREHIVQADDPWIGQAIRDLDISRRIMLVLIKRGDSTITPTADTIIEKGDLVVTYYR